MAGAAYSSRRSRSFCGLCRRQPRSGGSAPSPLDSLHWCYQRRPTTELSIENFRFQLRFRPKPYASDHVESSTHLHGPLPGTTGFGTTLRPRVKRTCSGSGHGARRATIGVTRPQLSGNHANDGQARQRLKKRAERAAAGSCFGLASIGKLGRNLARLFRLGGHALALDRLRTHSFSEVPTGPRSRRQALCNVHLQKRLLQVL